MLRRFVSAFFRLATAAAFVAALLLPAFNLASPLSGLADADDRLAQLDRTHGGHGHSHDDDDPVDPHGDHDHNVADHTHDIPNALSAVATVSTVHTPDWQLDGMDASLPKTGFRLERPPRSSRIA